MSLTRRQFLSDSTTAMTGAAALSMLGGRAGAAESAANTVVLALIGAGGRGNVHAKGMSSLPNVQFKYVCDVEAARRNWTVKEIEKNTGRAPTPIADLRQALDDKDVHGVSIATPDHWHALAAIQACQAGKDVYVEKPVGFSIWEGRKMIEAARKYKRVMQVGFQNRSAPFAQSARQYIQSGKLGKVVHVKVYNMVQFARYKPQRDSEQPQNFDWDRWLGARPLVAYNPGRHRHWTQWYDYCNGDLTNDGSHQMDLLRYVLGDPATPRFSYCAGGNFAYDSGRSTPELQEVTWEYPDFLVTATSSSFTPYNRKSNAEERAGKRFPAWQQNSERIEIFGTKQFMYLGRHGVGWQVLEGEGKVVAECHGIVPDMQHFQNYVDCIRSRQQPNGDIEQSHQSALLPHLANIAFRSGARRVEFDAAAERFVNCEVADKLLKPSFRSPYCVPEEV